MSLGKELKRVKNKMAKQHKEKVKRSMQTREGTEFSICWATMPPQTKDLRSPSTALSIKVMVLVFSSLALT